MLHSLEAMGTFEELFPEPTWRSGSMLLRELWLPWKQTAQISSCGGYNRLTTPLDPQPCSHRNLDSPGLFQAWGSMWGCSSRPIPVACGITLMGNFGSRTPHKLGHTFIGLCCCLRLFLPKPPSSLLSSLRRHCDHSAYSCFFYASQRVKLLHIQSHLGIYFLEDCN